METTRVIGDRVYRVVEIPPMEAPSELAQLMAEPPTPCLERTLARPPVDDLMHPRGGNSETST